MSFHPFTLHPSPAFLCSCSKLSQHSRSRSAGVLPPVHAEEQQQPGAAAGAAGTQQQQQPQLHPRARSCSPAELAALVAERSAAAGADAPASSAGSSSSLRGRRSSQLRPPRPPPLQPLGGGSPFESVVSAGEREEETPRLVTGSGWQLAAGSGSRAVQPPPSRQQAESRESFLGEGWEAVDLAEASEASLTLPCRDFSTAHLLAPQLDCRVVAGVAPRATSSSSSAGSSFLGGGRGGSEAVGGFSGTARAKVCLLLYCGGRWRRCLHCGAEEHRLLEFGGILCLPACR